MGDERSGAVGRALKAERFFPKGGWGVPENAPGF